MTDADPPASPDTGAGEALAAARRSLGLSVEDVALQLKFGARQIVALEEGRYDRLPTGTFARGMVRSYARLLKLDPEPLVGRIASHVAPAANVDAAIPFRKPIPFSDSGRRVNLLYAGLSLAVLGVIAAVLWEWREERVAQARLTFVPAAQAPLEPMRETLAQAATPPSIATETLAREPAPAAKAGAHRIVLRFDRQSWVEIRDGGGRILISQLNPAGSERAVEGAPPFDVVIGNAHHVRLTYDDRPIDLMPHVKVEVARLSLP